MNIPSIIVLLIIGIAFILAVHSIIKNKNGCGNCNSCDICNNKCDRYVKK